ncbi:MAG: carbohydrate-binding domain-containing protein [Prevotella sp.]|nr:carbohydrate-binding domain-containing protein [Prevotella sp.]
MKKNLNLFITAMATLLTACSSGGELLDEYTQSINTSTSSGTSTSSASSTTTNSDLSNLSVSIDSTALSETETIPSDDEDYVENFSSTGTVYIQYNGSSATTTGTVSGVTVSIVDADVTVSSTVAGVNYVLSGTTTDGSFKLTSGENDKKFELTLAGVSINNNDGPAINIQSGKRAYIVLKDGTYNTLSDGTSYASSTEDQKGTLFSEGELLFSGKGHLSIDANTKAGIASDDYILIRPNTNIYVNASQGNGIKANDGIDVRGGVVNVEVSGTAAKGLSTDGYYTQSGGRVTAITTGGSEYDSDEKDVSGSAGVKADSTLTIDGGSLLVKSTGAGGKGLSSDQQIIINDGTVKAVTSGKTYTYSSSLDSKPKGIKADGNLTINGGAIMVKASGGEGAEGIEAKGTLNITGGTTEVYGYDDAINSALNLTISGGYVYAFSVNNDGIDSNRNLYIKGGTILAYGTTQPECGIDAAEGYSVYITGGTLMAVGGGESYPSSSSTQPSIAYGGKVSSGATIAIVNGTTEVASYVMGRSYGSSVSILLTAPGLVKGSSYTVTVDGTTVGTISSLSSPYSTIGSTSSSMGGGRLGGW